MAIGIMIEGQEGLTWDRWRALCADVERLGFASLRRSDHFFSVMGEHARDCIDCWTSLALAAEWTSRIEFGPMVTPLTFKLPALLAREAAAVDLLAGGRLILGLGAGWNVPEHEAFGIPFPSLKERFDNLEAGIERIYQTWEISNRAPRRRVEREPARPRRLPLQVGDPRRLLSRPGPLARRDPAFGDVRGAGRPRPRRAAPAGSGAGSGDPSVSGNGAGRGGERGCRTRPGGNGRRGFRARA
ncbi:MAG: LLM class flavin-dependent oxidoreductase [Chloroflexi bacterium]|nr:MAG: LLM class flavin-dependent oxidoreductase [Chloroflexota bacterium]